MLMSPGASGQTKTSRILLLFAPVGYAEFQSVPYWDCMVFCRSRTQWVPLDCGPPAMADPPPQKPRGSESLFAKAYIWIACPIERRLDLHWTDLACSRAVWRAGIR